MDSLNSNFILPSTVTFHDISNRLDIKIHDDLDLISYLRTLYSLDYKKFDSVLVVLKLLGVKFSSKLDSRVFENWEEEISNIIVVSNDHNRYERIISILNLEYFMVSFNIDSDLFFNNFSINHLAHYLKIEKELLVSTFHSNGFKLKEIQEFIKEQRNETDIDYSISIQSNEEEITEIDLMFNQNKFSIFRTYCKFKDVKTLSEINNEILLGFSKVTSVGKGKMLAVKNRIADIKAKNVDLDSKRILTDNITLNLIYILLDNDFRTACKISEIEYFDYVDSILNESSSKEEIEKLNSSIIEIIDYSKENLERYNLKQKIKEISNLDSKYGLMEIPIIELFVEDDQTDFSELISYQENISIGNINNYISNLEATTINTLINKITELMDDYRYLLNHEPVLDQRSREVVLLRMQGETLNEIGDKYLVTRERIRQIEIKAKKTYDLYINKFLKFVFPVIKHMKIITYSGIMELLFDEKSIFSYFVMENLVSRNIFFRKRSTYFHESLPNIILELLNEERYGFRNSLDSFNGIVSKQGIKEYALELTQLGGNQSIHEDIESYLRLEYYNESDLTFFKGVGYKDKIYYILTQDEAFDYKIELNPRGFEDTVNALQHYFNDDNYRDYDLDSRALFTRLLDCEDLGILRTSKDYCELVNLDSISIELIEYIKKITYIELREINHIEVNNLYINYQEKLTNMGVDNDYYLYSLVKNYLNDFFVTGYGNTMTIKLIGSKGRVPKSGKIIKFINDHPSGLTKKTLMDKFNLTEISFSQNVTNSQDILTYIIEKGEMNCILLSQINISKKLNEEIRNASKYRLNKQGYIATNELFNYLAMGELGAEMINTGINSRFVLGGLAKKYNDDVLGQPNLLYYKEKPMKLIEVIMQEFPASFNYEDIYQRVVMDYDYSEASMSKLLKDLDESQHYIHIGYRKYINSSIVDFEAIDLSKIDQLLDHQFYDRVYLTLEDLDYLSFSDVINFEGLNAIFLMNILKRLNYKVFDTGMDYRYPQMIILSNKSEITTLTQLTDHLVKNYMGEMNLDSIANYFSEIKVMTPNVFISSFSESSIYYVDEYKWIRRMHL